MNANSKHATTESFLPIKNTFTPKPLKKNIPRMFSQIITESVPFRPVGSRADLVEVLSQKATQSYHKHLAGLEGGCYLSINL